jgi:dTDP-4-amino-4,6-dideoxygalactose transaminase
MSTEMEIHFGDLRRQYLAIKDEIDQAVRETLQSGWFVLGRKVEEFEKAFAEYCGARFVVGVGSGTEGLHLALMVLEVGRGDEVITVANTCMPTVSAISLCGATVVLADVDQSSFTMDYHELERRISQRTRVIMPVHLYGQSADLEPIGAIAKKHGVAVVEDAAQAHGTEYHGKRIGSHGTLTCFSFYPSKNLGAFGDGGAVATDDEMFAEKLRMLRNYGQRDRYHHTIKGLNSRLDELQAAILNKKLKHLDAWNARRREIAQMYADQIKNQAVLLPLEQSYGKHVYHMYVVRVQRREEFQAFLASRGIETLIHYPIPVHLQESYRDLGYSEGDFPITETVAKEVVSLPIYPELTDKEVLHVSNVINEFDRRG